ncbi:MAG: peroxiredoxin family protein [Ferrimicrobium sp.]
MSLIVGDLVPQFELESTEGRFRLSDHMGAPMCLAFYPQDFSPVCSAQMRAYSTSIDDFRELGAEMVGISPQSVSSHESFRRRLKISFPLLADVDREVAGAYGVLGPLGFYRRSVFVLDRSHRVAYLHIARAGLTFRSSDQLLNAVHSVVDKA